MDSLQLTSSIRKVCRYSQSKSEMRKLVKGGGVALNKEKLAAFDQPVTAEDLIDGKYLLVQKGKKNYSLIIVK